MNKKIIITAGLLGGFGLLIYKIIKAFSFSIKIENISLKDFSKDVVLNGVLYINNKSFLSVPFSSVSVSFFSEDGTLIAESDNVYFTAIKNTTTEQPFRVSVFSSNRFLKILNSVLSKKIKYTIKGNIFFIPLFYTDYVTLN